MAKILLVHHACFIGGGGKAALITSKMLREMGHEVVIFNSTYEKDMYNYFVDNGFECIEYPGLMGTIMHYSGGPRLYSRTFLRNLFGIIKTKKELTKVVKEHNPDLIVVNSIVLSWMVSLINKLNISSLCVVRETPKKGFISKILRFFLTKFTKVAFISDYDRNYYNLNINKSFLLRDSFKFDEKYLQITKKQACQKINVSEKKFNVLFLGGTSELKGWSTVKECISNFQNSNINFIIAGYSDEVKKIRNKAVSYVGVVKNIEYLYRACDIVILPSTEPHQLMPLFEAGFLKVPVITSDYIQLKENIINYETGLTVPPNNSEELENAILNLYNDSSLREKLVLNNFNMSFKHEYSNVKDSFQKDLEEILKEPN